MKRLLISIALAAAIPAASAFAEGSAAASTGEAYDWSLVLAGGIGILGLLWLRRQINRL